MAFNVEISEKVEQPLMSRSLLKGTVAYDAAPPSFVELKKYLAASLKADEQLVVIQSTHTVFGMPKSLLEVHIYKSKGAVDAFSSKVILARNLPRVKKAPAAAAEK